MPSRLLKTKPSIPYHLENRLVNHWGYAVEKRVVNEFILFKKSYISDKAAANDDGLKRTIRASVGKPTTSSVVYTDFKSALTLNQKKALEKRCDNIVNFFPDPYQVPESVRSRLKVIMQKLTVPEAQFVQEYMDENFPIVDTGK